MDINVREYLGNKVSAEDAIVLRETLKAYMNEGVTLDFAGVDNVPSTFLNTLFGDLINEIGRDNIFQHINVKNLSNYSDYSRVVLGTAFVS